ncbi:hypothetical protein DENSPDRAFT_932374 [Dentipellis sp. KUC8613]|nr:hypothetical protein DENSPDRAFT_932374 [Dentipellis sp. KUC8613]
MGPFCSLHRRLRAPPRPFNAHHRRLCAPPPRLTPCRPVSRRLPAPFCRLRAAWRRGRAARLPRALSRPRCAVCAPRCCVRTAPRRLCPATLSAPQRVLFGPHGGVCTPRRCLCASPLPARTAPPSQRTSPRRHLSPHAALARPRDGTSHLLAPYLHRPAALAAGFWASGAPLTSHAPSRRRTPPPLSFAFATTPHSLAPPSPALTRRLHPHRRCSHSPCSLALPSPALARRRYPPSCAVTSHLPKSPPLLPRAAVVRVRDDASRPRAAAPHRCLSPGPPSRPLPDAVTRRHTPPSHAVARHRCTPSREDPTCRAWRLRDTVSLICDDISPPTTTPCALATPPCALATGALGCRFAPREAAPALPAPLHALMTSSRALAPPSGFVASGPAPPSPASRCHYTRACRRPNSAVSPSLAIVRPRLPPPADYIHSDGFPFVGDYHIAGIFSQSSGQLEQCKYHIYYWSLRINYMIFQLLHYFS